MKIKDKLNIAWASGIIDGEGCINVSKRKPSKKRLERSSVYYIRIKVSMADKKAIYKLYNIFKVGSVIKSNTSQTLKNNWSPQYSWTCVSRQCLSVLKKILIYSITKKKEIFFALKFLEIPIAYNRSKITPNWILKRREKIYRKLQTLKPKNNL